MPNGHSIYGGKIQIYRRAGSSSWQCSAYVAGKNHRVSTKSDSLTHAKTLRHWRSQALRDLLADLERVKPQALQRQAAGDGDKGLNVRTTRMASIELNRLCDAEFKVDRNFIGPTAKGGVGDQRLIELPADSVMVMIDRVGQEVANA
ncbi:hypothetical protein [Phenylobacterium sp.]|uniref:hypothetical protein n=1 Tax=Phenylobacterium sp. TaxID=1871053 RepID=UPI002FC8C3FF